VDVTERFFTTYDPLRCAARYNRGEDAMRQRIRASALRSESLQAALRGVGTDRNVEAARQREVLSIRWTQRVRCTSARAAWR
jgi:hypothetical protein